MKVETIMTLMKKRNLILLTAGIGFSLLSGCAPAGNDGETPDSAEGESGSHVRFQPEFPPEQIEGTPVEGGAKNIEAVPSQPPSLRMPEDATLISGEKPVTASDDMPIIGELAYITDGLKRAGDGYYVELMPGMQWVQIDLEATHEIHGIWMWHYHRQERAYHGVVVQISDDENFESGVTTVFNNDYENALGLGRGGDRPYMESRYGKPVSVDGVEGRYVRLYSNGNTSNEMNHYIEVEVYGKPAE